MHTDTECGHIDVYSNASANTHSHNTIQSAKNDKYVSNIVTPQHRTTQFRYTWMNWPFLLIMVKSRTNRVNIERAEDRGAAAAAISHHHRQSNKYWKFYLHESANSKYVVQHRSIPPTITSNTKYNIDAKHRCTQSKQQTDGTDSSNRANGNFILKFPFTG